MRSPVFARSLMQTESMFFLVHDDEVRMNFPEDTTYCVSKKQFLSTVLIAYMQFNGHEWNTREAKWDLIHAGIYSNNIIICYYRQQLR